MMERIRERGGNLWGWLRENSIIATFLAGQAILILGWGITQEITDRQQISDIAYLKDGQHAQDITISRIDERGSREIPEIKSRLSQHEIQFTADQKTIQELITHGSPVLKTQIDAIKDQQNRNIVSIENLRNLLNDHMRMDNEIYRNNIPLPPRRSPQ